VKKIIRENDPKISPADAAKLLGVSAQFIRVGLQRDRFPWGYAVKQSENRYTYCINRKRFLEVEGIEQ
jgi:hypothetical protein